jgi:hypothetical protein
MIQQIVIEAEPPGDAQSMFRLSIDANVIAKGVTVSQAYYLVGEVLGRIGLPENTEAVTFDAEGGDREGVRVSHVHHHDQTDDLWRAVEISERIAQAPRLTQPCMGISVSSFIASDCSPMAEACLIDPRGARCRARLSRRNLVFGWVHVGPGP